NEFELKLHPLKSVVLAEGLTPESHIRQLLECWRDFMADAPVDLKWNLELRLAPLTRRFRRSFAVGRWPPVHWFGQAHLKLRSRTLSAPFSLCHPDSVRSQIVSFLRLQTMADSDFPHGRRYYTKSGYFQHLEDVTIDRFLD